MTGRGVEIDVVARDEEAAARAVAERLAGQARAGGHVVLTGGSTPKRAYELAAELEPDWSRVELWWGDERCVPPGDERSNYGMAKEALLDRLDAAAARRPPDAAAKRAGSAARSSTSDELARARALRPRPARASARTATSPRSIPASRPSTRRARRAVGAEAHLEPYVDRITLTLPMLAAAQRGAVPRRGRLEGGRGGARVRRRAVARDARQPRPLGARPDARRARPRRRRAALPPPDDRAPADSRLLRTRPVPGTGRVSPRRVLQGRTGRGAELDGQAARGAQAAGARAACRRRPRPRGTRRASRTSGGSTRPPRHRPSRRPPRARRARRRRRPGSRRVRRASPRARTPRRRGRARAARASPA